VLLKFDANLHQLPGTYIQQAHRTKSIKGKSSSASKKRTKCIDDSTADIQDTNTEQEVSAVSLGRKRKKSYTPRPVCNGDLCDFNFSFFVTEKIINGICDIHFARTGAISVIMGTSHCV
jgi:hypothetical protein